MARRVQARPRRARPVKNRPPSVLAIAVGDPDLALDPGARGHLVEQQLGEGFFAAEVACRVGGGDGDDAGADDSDRVTLDRGRGRSGARSGGAAGLGVAAAHAAPDSAGARRCADRGPGQRRGQCDAAAAGSASPPADGAGSAASACPRDGSRSPALHRGQARRTMGR